MRISDDRYSRDRLRLDVAMHFIRHEARTHTIRQWTGLSDDRIRKLYRSYHAVAGEPPVRHRGKSPQQAGYFLRSVRLRQESAALAGICGLLGVQAAAPGAQEGNRTSGGKAGAQPVIGRAALLCQAYEAYRGMVGAPLISFEHAVLLLAKLARGGELRLEGCQPCGALQLVDRYALQAPHCPVCTSAGTTGPQQPPAVPGARARRATKRPAAKGSGNR
jgi:hypothetical protein